MLTNSFSKMLGIATVIGAVSGFGGMNLSFHHDLPSGSTIVLTGTAFFILAYLGGGRLRARAATVAHAH
jgi:ABC-type Mn2+/Zn2+ transport system permease subunit